MKHVEYCLKFRTEILERSGRGINIAYYKQGDELVVNQETFDTLLQGRTITQYTREGLVNYNKYSFENEVGTTIISIEKGIRKLGQRNKVAPLRS